jgi:hypothetical protein
MWVNYFLPTLYHSSNDKWEHVFIVGQTSTLFPSDRKWDLFGLVPLEAANTQNTDGTASWVLHKSSHLILTQVVNWAGQPKHSSQAYVYVVDCRSIVDSNMQ